MEMDEGNGRVRLSTAEEQMVCALAERMQAFLRELNPVQLVIDQAETCWMREMLPEAAAPGHERAIWATALRVMTQYLSERLAPAPCMMWSSSGAGC